MKLVVTESSKGTEDQEVPQEIAEVFGIADGKKKGRSDSKITTT